MELAILSGIFKAGNPLEQYKKFIIPLAVVITIATMTILFLDTGSFINYLLTVGIIYLLTMYTLFDLERHSLVKVLNISGIIIFSGFLAYIVLKVINILR